MARRSPKLVETTRSAIASTRSLTTPTTRRISCMGGRQIGHISIHHSCNKRLSRYNTARYDWRRLQSTSTAPGAAAEKIPEPSFQDLKLVALGQGIPFIGFGFMDNAILIVAGDAIDASLGVYLGISTLCAAAIGNIISDLAGIGLGTMIEDFCANTLKLPVPNITASQRTLRSVRSASNLGMAIGMTIGCLIGMFPLLFLDSSKVEQRKKQAHLDDLFQDVMQEAKSLIEAESTCLYVRVRLYDPKESKKRPPSFLHSVALGEYFQPDVEGEHFYAMKYNLPQSSQGEELKLSEVSSRFIPIGKGIISRAALTGEAWVISDLKKEPDFLPAIKEQYGEIPDHLKHMLVVPVLDGQGRAIAVIRALNKKASSGKTGFTDADVQILKNLASHISVSLQSVFRDEDKEEMRLRDTIRLLKQHGLEGIEDKSLRRPRSLRTRPSLFPSSTEKES